MAARILFSTAAEVSIEININGSDVPCAIRQGGLAGVEVVSLQETVDDGATWVTAKSQGATMNLTVDQTSIGLAFPGRYRLYKGITAGVVKCTLSTGRDI